MGSTGPAWASEPIAIIGIGCKFAGDASNPSELWKLLAEGKSAWSEIPASRFNPKGAYHANSEKLSTMHVKGAHFMNEDIGLFDAAFFNYSAETAATLDPQFRLQLESVYEALENAGLPLAQVAGTNTSVFAGTFVHDYRDSLIRDEDNLPRYLLTGSGTAMASNRISHFFDFRGASMTIDTGCSTALVALHQAVQSLRSGESDMSVVGGTNVLINPDNFKAMGSLGFLSPDGRCFTFDSRANGYGRGEGVATIVIKRLRDAIAAGDPIRSVIRETLLNQDGKTETITSPSKDAQQSLMRNCYARAGIDPLGTQYFEAHGTGTPTGDPIEVGSIASVFQGKKRSMVEPLWIGSVKTNIGHTEATSGLASVIKVTLAMEHGMIPPSINFENPNPKLSLEEWGIKVARELEEWPALPGTVRRASVNNFGYGGSNSHVIMEDGQYWLQALGTRTLSKKFAAQNGVDSLPSASYETSLLMLSGKDEQTTKVMVSNLKDFLEDQEKKGLSEADAKVLLEQLSYTLGQRRTIFPWVASYPVPITQGIAAAATALESRNFRASKVASRLPRIGMVFTGQGAQWYAMGRELITTYPVFGASIKEADAILNDLGADWSLMEELHRDAESTRVNGTAFSIPICVAVQIGLVRLLNTWGIKPTAVTSHSSGEIAAAYTVGAISLRRAMGIAYFRSKLAAELTQRATAKGGMIAVGLGHRDAARYLSNLTGDAKAVIACINSPSSTTVAGDLPAVLELEAKLQYDGVFGRRLRVETAYHSHHMAPIAEEYRTALQNMQDDESSKINRMASIAYASPVTGYRMTSAENIANADHWVSSLLQPVLFVDAFTEMVLGYLDSESDASPSSVDLVVEVGPHTALGGPIQEVLGLPDFEGIKLPYYGCLVRHTNAMESLQALAANLIREGYPADMEAINFPHGRGSNIRVLTNLPPYPWNHSTRHWIEPRVNKALRRRSQEPHHLLGQLVPGTNLNLPSWRHILRPAESPWVRDHMIQSNMLYPGCGFISLAIEAVRQQIDLVAGDKGNFPPRKIAGYHIRDVDVLQALIIPDTTEGLEIQTVLRPVSEKSIGVRGWKQFEIYSVTADNDWTQHAYGLILVEFGDPDQATGLGLGKSKEPLDTTADYAKRIDPEDMWNVLTALGLQYGPTFRNIKSIIQSGKEMRSISDIVVPDTSVAKELPYAHVVHPALLDAAAQATFTALPGTESRQDSPRVFQSIERIWISSRISSQIGHVFQADTFLHRADAQGIEADITMFDKDRTGEDTKPVLEINNLIFSSLGRSASTGDGNIWERQLCTRVHWDVHLPDSEADDMDTKTSTMVATVPPITTQPLSSHDVVLVTSNKMGHAVDLTWLADLQQAISEDGSGTGSLPIVCTIETLTQASIGGKICVFVGEIDKPLLRDLGAETVEGIRTMIIGSKGLLWLTRGAAVDSPDPELALAQGFLRSLRNEYPTRRFVSLDLDPETTLWSLDSIPVIQHVLQAGFGNDDSRPREFEYAARGDVILVPRILKDEAWSKAISPDDFADQSTSEVVSQPLYQPDRPLSMHVGMPGLMDTIAFDDDPSRSTLNAASNFSPNVIEVEPRAYGVNFRDVMVAMGQLHERVMGLECSGVIKRVGTEAANRGYAVGDKVFCLLRGPFGSRVNVEWTNVAHMPEGLSFEDAASLPVIFCTAYICLIDMARLKCGQNVLIHAAAGGVGQAAIMIAKHLGLEIYATVGTAEKRALVTNKYGIPDNHIFSSRDASFATGIMAATRGRGVDAVINSLAGPLLQESFNVLAPFGHFLEIGKRDLEINSHLEMRPFSRQVSFSAFYLLASMQHSPLEVHRVLNAITQLLESQAIAPVHPVTVFPIGEFAKAFRLLQTGKHMGKVVLSTGPEAMVPVRPRTPRAKFSSEASYLIVGGLGGIGRSIAHWMVARGARNLIFMSRSAGRSRNSTFLDGLRATGVQVEAVSCNVSDHDDLVCALRVCEERGLPPIRGVIQAAMVLQDTVFEQMSLANWHAAVQPKVHGTWNLHQAFDAPDSLDFFVILSSVVGVTGNASQANYAAAGSYQDALARWRVARGLPAVAIDLGAVKGIGVAQETAGVLSRLQRIGHIPINEEQVLAVLDSAILAPYESQVVIGLHTGPGPHWNLDGDSPLGRDARFMALRPAEGGQKTAGDGSGSLASRLAAASSAAEAVDLVGVAIAEKLSDIFMLSVDDIDLANKPAHFGIDSLVSVELRNMLLQHAGAEVSIFGIMQSPSLAALAADVAAKSTHVQWDGFKN